MTEKRVNYSECLSTAWTIGLNVLAPIHQRGKYLCNTNLKSGIEIFLLPSYGFKIFMRWFLLPFLLSLLGVVNYGIPFTLFLDPF